MIASLYQVASSANGALRNQWAWNTDDVGGRRRRVQGDVVPAVCAPGVAGAVQQVFDAIWWMTGPRHHRNLYPARLRPGGIEVDDHDYHVDFSPTSTLLLRCGREGAAFGERQQPFVVGPEEAKGPVLLQRRVLAAEAVDLGDQRPQAARPLQVPVPDLILLRVQVLLAPGGQRRHLRQFEGRPIDAVARAQRRGEHEAQRARSATTGLQRVRQYVLGIRPEVRPEVLADRGLCQLSEVLAEFPALVAPGEVRVRLVEAELFQPVHDLRPCE